MPTPPTPCVVAPAALCNASRRHRRRRPAAGESTTPSTSREPPVARFPPSPASSSAAVVAYDTTRAERCVRSGRRDCQPRRTSSRLGKQQESSGVLSRHTAGHRAPPWDLHQSHRDRARCEDRPEGSQPSISHDGPRRFLVSHPVCQPARIGNFDSPNQDPMGSRLCCRRGGGERHCADERSNGC